MPLSNIYDAVTQDFKTVNDLANITDATSDTDPSGTDADDAYFQGNVHNYIRELAQSSLGKAYNPTELGITLAAAVTHATNSNGYIVVNDTQTLTGNLDITVPVVIEPSGSIDQVSYTLTFSKSVSLPFKKVFFGSGFVYFKQGSTPYVFPQWFGAVGDNSVDDTLAIQYAIWAASGTVDNSTLDAERISGPGVVLFSHGTYKITAKLNWYSGCALHGLQKSQSAPSEVPVLNWSTATTDSMIEVPNGTATGIFEMKNLALSYDTVAALGRPTAGVKFLMAAKQGVRFENCRFNGMNGYGVDFTVGYELADFRGCSFYNCSLAGIHFVSAGADSAHLSNCYIDNLRADLTDSGGFLKIDTSGVAADEITRIVAESIQMRTNTDIAATDGVIKITVDDGLSHVQVALTLINYTNVVDSGIAQADSRDIFVTPDYDEIDLVLINCETPSLIKGIPTLVADDDGSITTHVMSAISSGVMFSSTSVMGTVYT